ncbi:O-antigen ligase family protein [Patescibacteria group bacterium]|nr:O-antigen ligase family protein [Patescibacteria group bacterium]
MFKNLKIFRPILAILLLTIPLYPKFPLYGVTETYVAIRLEDILVSAALVFLLLHQIKNHFSLLKLPITKVFLAYFLAIFISTVTAIFIFKTDSPGLLLLNFLRHIEYMSLFFVAIAAINGVQDLKYPVIFMTIATLGVSLYGYGQKYLQFPVVSTMNEEFSKGQLLSLSVWTRINSTFAGHYDLAVYMSIVLIILGCLAVLSKNIYQKILLILIWLISFQILTYTASRVSTFALWGGMVLGLILIRKYLWIIPVSGLVIFSIMNSRDLNQRLLATINTIKPTPSQQNTATPTPTNLPTAAPPPIAVIKPPKVTPTPGIVHHGVPESYPPVDIDAGVSRSGEIRFNVEWPRAITAFLKNPLVGTGPGSITLATDNDFLRSLGESGLLGFVTFALILAWFIIRTIPLIFKKKSTILEKSALILMAAVITMLVNATFIDVFESSKTAFLFWIMMGIYYWILEYSQHSSKV